MNLFKESIILTKIHIRYGGDSTSTLALVVDYKGVAYLYTDADNDTLVVDGRMFSITSCPKYVKWLLDNSMDLLEMVNDDCPYDWYNDRNVVDGRKKEFLNILSYCSVSIGVNDNFY